MTSSHHSDDTAIDSGSSQLLESEVYIHEAGELSRRAVLDVGLKCPHSCTFCYYSYLDHSDDQFRGMRHAQFRSFDECKQILDGIRRNNFTSFDITGGEPSLHPDIVELTRYAHRELGLRGRLITLGQFLMRKLPGCSRGTLIEELLDAGLTNFLLSIHSVSEPLYETITGASWERLRSAMCYLDSRGYSYTSGTTVFAWNFAHLPEIASELLKHNVYMHNFTIMNAKYEWAHGHKSASVQARYSDLYPYLSQAIDILESHRIAVNVRYAPLCTMQGYERNLVGAVGVRYDPYEWMNKAGHQGGDPEFCATPLEIHPSGVDAGWVYNESASLRAPVIAHRGDKVYPAACRACKARSACDGVDPRYLEHHGSGELRPYHESTLHGPVPLARRAYMPAFRVKMSQWTDMKAVMRQAFEHIGTSASSTSAVGIVAAGNRRLDFSSQTLHPQAVRFCQSGRVALHLMTEDCDVWIRVGSDVIEVPLDFAETFARAFAKWPGVDILYADCQDLDAAGTVSHRSTPLVRARHLLGLPALSVLAFREKAASRLQANWLYKTVRSDASLFLVARTLGLNTRHLAVPMAVAARSPRLPWLHGRIGNDR